MGGDLALDTNVAIAYMKGDTSVILEFNRSRANIGLPAVVAGELYFGAEKSTRPLTLLETERFVAGIALIPIDLQTAKCFGQVKSALQLMGRPIPENDIWIAATCIQHGLILVTRDGHFSAVSGLSTVRW